ncbi:MAG: hypothetical protein Q9190_003198 [Brigantiaea leucoxantha]
MAAGFATPKSNGVSSAIDPSSDTRSKAFFEYQKIIKLRNEVFAGTHPRLRLLLQNEQHPTNTQAESIKPLHAPEVPQGAPQLGFHSQVKPTQVSELALANPKSNTTSQQLPNKPPFDPKTTSVSEIDPVLLTKSDVLVRAELSQKRQRIERTLEEQVRNRKNTFKPRPFDQDAWPDFDVDEVLRKAHELVKPFRPAESSAANRNASSSDSFDENTFYSSQMNETTSEEAERPEKVTKRVRQNQICKYYLDGAHCPYGDACTFSHDPALKQQRLGEQGSKAKNGETADTNKQAKPNSRNHAHEAPLNGKESGKPLSQADRIARLEAQLHALRAEKVDDSNHTPQNRSKDNREAHEEPIYSPPDAVAPNQVWPNQPAQPLPDKSRIQHPGSGPRQGSAEREYLRHNDEPPSPFVNDGRVVRNHITSPAAPQPARVSPLAVAKVSRISQIQPNHRSTDHSSRQSTDSASPRVNLSESVQKPNPRKRRRGRSPGDGIRNVVARPNAASPEIRIKDEPITPPPLSHPLETWQSHGRRREPVYIDAVSPQYGDRDRVVYEPNGYEPPQPPYVYNQRETVLGPVSRIVNSTHQPRHFYEEPDLRRVVSTRQARYLDTHPPRYSSPSATSARVPTQVYLPRQDSENVRQRRVSVQPVLTPHGQHDRSPSPVTRQTRVSPTAFESAVMAPPPRRIIMDQYGNRFVEAPTSREQQPSVVPLSRHIEYDQPLEVPARYASIARDAAREYTPLHTVDERHLIRRANSPASPHFVEYYSPTGARDQFDRKMELAYGDGPDVRQNNGIRMAEYRTPHEEMRSVERVTRVPSVNPPIKRPEAAPEFIHRAQSVRPEGTRIISLGRARDVVRPDSRPVSFRPNEGYGEPAQYETPSRSSYYPAADSRGGQYAEETRRGNVIYEAPITTGGRPLPRY